MILVAGCRQESPNESSQSDAKPKAGRSQVERGPVRLSVEVEPAAARLSDEPKLTLEIEYPQGVKVRKPEFGSALGDFVIRDFREPLPRVQGDRQILQQIYTLEPTRAGKIVIDPIAVNFTDNRPNGTGKEHTLETEPITVEVAAAVADEAPSLDQLHPPADPVPLPQSSAAAWLACRRGGRRDRWRRLRSGGCGAASTSNKAGPPLTPAELAYLELQRLLESQEAQGDVKLFYVELTAIVRRYIERTTGIRAPEQTTQEFLHEISRRSDFPARRSPAAAKLPGSGRPGEVCRLPAPRRTTSRRVSAARRCSWAAPEGRGGGRMSFRFQDPLWLAVAVGAGR